MSRSLCYSMILSLTRLDTTKEIKCWEWNLAIILAIGRCAPSRPSVQPSSSTQGAQYDPLLQRCPASYLVQPTLQRPSIHLRRSRETAPTTLRLLRKRYTRQLRHCRVTPLLPHLHPNNSQSLTTTRKHDHTIPGINSPAGFLLDYTDRGILWDPTLNAYAYTYNPATATFEAGSAEFPVAWLNFNGQWGDDQPPNEPSIFGEAKYVAGPNGPKFKGLNRTHVCPSTPCVVLPFRTRTEVGTAPPS